MWKTAVFVSLLASATIAQEDDNMIRPPEEITEATLVDSEALARLEKPGEIFFSDDFETAASVENYFEISGLDDGRTQFVSAPEQIHSGTGAIQFTAPERSGSESGAGANLWFGPKGYDVVYFRRYIKFAADYDQGNLNHTGGGLAGVAGTGKWDGMGQAGKRPQGDDRFTCSFEPWRDWKRYPAPGYMFLYTYWMDMTQDPDGNYWGNFMEPSADRRIVLERDRWYCLEQMVKTNDPGQDNGELAAWVDGQLYVHFRGFRWRTVENLKVKRASFGIYIHQAEKDNTVWYDDVVLSTGYIGTLESSTSIEKKTWGKLKSRDKTE